MSPPEKSKTVALLLSAFFGHLGASRLYVGDWKGWIKLVIFLISIILLITAIVTAVNKANDLAKCIADCPSGNCKCTKKRTLGDYLFKDFLILFLIAIVFLGISSIWQFVDIIRLVYNAVAKRDFHHKEDIVFGKKGSYVWSTGSMGTAQVVGIIIIIVYLLGWIPNVVSPKKS